MTDAATMPVRCLDTGHEFLCRYAEGSCWKCAQQKAQRQDALNDQLRDLAQIARKEGMYDAMDWILSSLVVMRPRAGQDG